LIWEILGNNKYRKCCAGVMRVQKENTEKKKYKKKNNFKINIIFNEKGETLDKIIERAFWNYLLKK